MTQQLQEPVAIVHVCKRKKCAVLILLDVAALERFAADKCFVDSRLVFDLVLLNTQQTIILLLQADNSVKLLDIDQTDDQVVGGELDFAGEVVKYPPGLKPLLPYVLLLVHVLDGVRILNLLQPIDARVSVRLVICVLIERVA